MAGDRRFTKHGFPKGFRFVPTSLELITILSYKLQGRRLPPKVADIFHHLNILQHHPQELHDMYEHDKEHRYIYFFSYRQRSKSGADGGPVHKKRQRGQDEDDSEPRPTRVAKGGGWKPSGGGQVLFWPKEMGGYVAGKMVTMVFYDQVTGGKPVKSQWGMHEFTLPLDLKLLLKPTKNPRIQVHELALYRLYKLKSGDVESDEAPANVAAAAADGGHFSAQCPAGAGQPPFGIFTAAGASTSRMPPPPQLQQQQHRMPNVVGRPQLYHHHRYAFGGARPSAGHQQVRAMAMPPAYGAGMLPGRQLPQHARPPFARPPAPSQMPALPAAGNPALSHQQAPAKATGQQASHSGATRSPLLSAPPAAGSPSAAAKQLAPMTVAAHGGAGGQEAGGDFGATRSSPATGSRPAEQDATATAEPGQHLQCVKPEETVLPPIPNDDGNYDLLSGSGVYDDNCLFTMDELYALFDEPLPTQQGDDI